MKKMLRGMSVCFALCLMVSMLTGCFSHDEEFVVEGKSWCYTQEIEKNVLCDESGWFLPDGATLVKKNRERYKRKYDSEGNPRGWKYRTKYYYQIWRWKHERDVISSGENDTPYFADPELGELEKVASRTKEYYIHCKTVEGESTRYRVGEELWNSIGLGDTIRAKITISRIEEIYEIVKPLEAPS